MDNMTRRGFLAGSAGTAVALLAAGACSSDDPRPEEASDDSTPPRALPAPADAPFDTVVVLMMENRTFDHLLGWMPGTEGVQEGLSFVDAEGVEHDTYPLAPDWQGCSLKDPDHTWQGMAAQLNGGACDGFLKTQPTGDLFPIGFYREGDLPILQALAGGYSLFDHYFASMLGPTWPNRLYQLSATTDLDHTGLFPTGDTPRPVHLETAIFDRLGPAGLTGGYYTWGEPMTELYASRKYDQLTHPIDRFWIDAEAGSLPNVTFVDPD